MSKFGAHITIGKRDGFGAALQQCALADSPVPVVVALDQNVWADVQNFSPETIVAFRTQIGGHPNPPEIWQGDPVAVADAWYDFRKPTWLLNPANYYLPCNEMDAAIISHFDWQCDFELRMMQRADADGLHLGIGVHTTGTPSDDGGTTRFEKLARLIPALQYAKAHGHVWIKHEYGFATTLQQSAPSHALRYRADLEYLAQFNADPLVIIGECSDYNGYGGESGWLDGTKWYDSQVINDHRVIGFAAYQLGGAENWYQLIGQWSDHVSANPTPITPPPAGLREFDYWLDEDTGQNLGTANPLTFVITGNRRIKAISRPKVIQYTCQLSSDSPDVTVTGGGLYDVNSTVSALAVNA